LAKMTKRKLNLAVLLTNAVTLVLLIGAGVSFVLRSHVNKNRVVDLYLTIASAAIGHDHFDEAVNALSKAREIDPNNTKAETELLKATLFRISTKYDVLNRIVDSDQIDKARADCERLLDKNPKSAELVALRGMIYAIQDQPTSAIETYKNAVELNPAYPNVLNYWGYTVYQWKFPDDWRAPAVEKFNEAIKLDSSYVAPRINLAFIDIAQGEHGAAVKTLSETPGLILPEDWQRNFDADLKSLSETAEMAKDNADVYFLWGTGLVEWGERLKDEDSLEAEKKFLGALDRFRIAEALRPDTPELHVNKGVALTALGRSDFAIDEYKRAIELEHDLLPAHENLAQLLYRKGNFEGALFYAQESLRIVKQTIEQFNARKNRTPDDFARKRLQQWVTEQEAEQSGLESAIRQVGEKLRPTTASDVPQQ
jgi:tetratricopeptide (TPR) repeat protein